MFNIRILKLYDNKENINDILISSFNGFILYHIIYDYSSNNKYIGGLNFETKLPFISSFNNIYYKSGKIYSSYKFNGRNLIKYSFTRYYNTGSLLYNETYTNGFLYKSNWYDINGNPSKPISLEDISPLNKKLIKYLHAR